MTDKPAITFITLSAENSEVYVPLANTIIELLQKQVVSGHIAIYIDGDSTAKIVVPDNAEVSRLKQQIAELERRLVEIPITPLYHAVVVKPVNMRNEIGTLAGDQLPIGTEVSIYEEVAVIGGYHDRVVIDPSSIAHPRNIWKLNIQKKETGGGSSAFYWPTDYRVVTQHYGENPYKYGYGRNGHEGIDLRAPEGTPIYACMTGNVMYSGLSTGVYGNIVKIETNLNGKYVVVDYCHLQKILPLRAVVTRGQQIGLAGQTGRTRGAHLHLNVFVDRIRVNPASYLGI